MTMSELPRDTAFGQSEERPLTAVDRFGVWLSGVQIRRHVGSFAGKRLGDFGCGYHAAFDRTVLGDVQSAVLVDVALAPDLKSHPKVTAIEGPLPDAMEGLPPESLDVVMMTSVLEHLTRPEAALAQAFRLLAPGGVFLVNVPSWWGKRLLELSAFRFGMSPPEEMDDHKMYYDVRDLWPLLVRAGFRPRHISCFSHKFGLNTFAVCRK